MVSNRRSATMRVPWTERGRSSCHPTIDGPCLGRKSGGSTRPLVIPGAASVRHPGLCRWRHSIALRLVRGIRGGGFMRAKLGGVIIVAVAALLAFGGAASARELEPGDDHGGFGLGLE